MDFFRERLPIIQRDKVENKRNMSPVHTHEHYEFYYLINGKTKYFIGDEIFEVESGDIVFVPKGLFHKTDSETCMHTERLLIFFNDEIFDELTRPILKEMCLCRVIRLPQEKLEHVEKIMHKLEKESKRKKMHSDIIIKLCILELLTLICRYKVSYVPHHSKTNEDIYNISQYIRANFNNEISLKSLSKSFAISESHLSRRFKEVSGIGINEYITYVRIMNAENLLRTKKLPITEIAAMCGFNDSNYFSTVFKRLKGVTPLKFAKMEYDE